MLNKKILYISYDGMTDSLGQSQVLPYLSGLSKEGYSFTILSFEKPSRYEKNRPIIEQICQENQIKWHPLSFTASPPILSKIYDRWRMMTAAKKLYKEEKFDMVHCRSYLSAEMGLMLKRAYSCKLLFDKRGFWADEKKDIGAWDVSNFFFRQVYKHYKRKEKQFFIESDAIVSLTYAAKKEILGWEYGNEIKAPIAVIPCCADQEHFTLTNEEAKKYGRKLLDIPQDSFVFSYLGSIGTWYMNDEMMLLFKAIKTRQANSKFLIVSHTPKTEIEAILKKHEINPMDVIITEASRKEVPLFMKSSDISVSFIKPLFSKIASSPTKLGELLFMGIPVIANSRVGDVKDIMCKTKGGICIDTFDEKAISKILTYCFEGRGLANYDAQQTRENSKGTYSLNLGIKKYYQLYEDLLN